MIVRQDRELRKLWKCALPLWERFPNLRSGASDVRSKTERRIERWSQVLGGYKLLAKRLRAVRLTASQLPVLLNGFPSDAALPQWTETLAAALAAPVDGHVETWSGLVGHSQPEQFPFQEVLGGFLGYACKRLKAEAHRTLSVLQPTAIASLERELLSHLCFLASLALGHEFYTFRFKRAPLSALESLWVQRKSSRDIYAAFVRHMRRGGLRAFLYRYPVLARLLAQSIDFWVQSTTNFCHRFVVDFDHVKRFFCLHVECPEQALSDVSTGLSDRHNFGQTVAKCVLQSGETIIYKPRTVSGELAFFDFIQWLNTLGLSLDLFFPRLLDCGSHGWVEYVPANPCNYDTEIKRFYVRAGMLLAAAHVLGVTDIHCENLIASGEYPVIIDLETLLTEQIRNGRVQHPSVITTGMLPQLHQSANRREPDASAMGAEQRRDSGLRYPIWTSINTDQMMLSEGAVPSEGNHRVRIGDQFPSVAQYLKSFQEGFQEAYLYILKNRRRFLAGPSPIHEFENLELRVLVRDSEIYARIQLHVLHPELLEDGLDRSIEMEWLARPLCVSRIPLKGRLNIYAHEWAAMERLDIPHFTTSTWGHMGHAPDSKDFLAFGGKRDASVFRRRLAGLSKSDCRKQLALISRSVKKHFSENSSPYRAKSRTPSKAR